MDKSTLYGLLAGFALVAGAILTQGDIMLFVSLSSLTIVGGGVVSSAIVNFSFKDVSNSLSFLLDTLTGNSTDLRTDIELMNMFARRARKEGMLALEEDIQNIEEPLLQSGLQYVLDGVNKDTLMRILDDQLASAERRLDKSVTILKSMAEYSPAFGMIGTVIGLILMLQNIQDPESLGAGLAVALLTTLYGTIFANMIFTPIAGKLQHMGEKEIIRKRMFMSAIVSIIEEENPRIMENKMLNFVSPEERAEYLTYFEKNSFDSKREERLYENWKQYQFEPWPNLRIALETG